MPRSSYDVLWRIKQKFGSALFEHSETGCLDAGIYQCMSKLHWASSFWNSLWHDIPTCLMAVCRIAALCRRLATAVMQLKGVIHDTALRTEVAVLCTMTSPAAGECAGLDGGSKGRVKIIDRPRSDWFQFTGKHDLKMISSTKPFHIKILHVLTIFPRTKFYVSSCSHYTL
jgi:hypothetical protein